MYDWFVVRQADAPAIEVKGLRKSYGSWPVLWDLSLNVKWGEFLVVFGANGVGKTTLLKVLSTQARPDDGSVLVAGLDTNRNSGRVRRRIGVVAHKAMLYEDMSCRENLVFYGRMFSLSDIPERVDRVLSLVGLESRVHHKVGTLSHGMQKRLAIARAILHEPVVLLLDEPEAGLDQEALGMLGQLLDEWKASGRSIIMTTHNVEQGLAWGDKAAILSGGKIAFEESRRTLDPAGFRGTYRQYVETTP